MEEEEKELIKKYAPLSDEEEKEGLIVEDDGSFVIYDKKEKNNNTWRVLDSTGVDVYSEPRISKKVLLDTKLLPNDIVEGDRSADHPGWVRHTEGWSPWYLKNKILLKQQIKASWWRVLSPMGLLVRNSKVAKSDHSNVVCIVPCGSKLFGEAKEDDVWLSHTDCRYPLHPSKKERKLMEKYPYRRGYSMMHLPDDPHKQYLQRSTVTVEDEKAFIERAKYKNREKNEPCQCCGLKAPKVKKKKKKLKEEPVVIESELEVPKSKNQPRKSLITLARFGKKSKNASLVENSDKDVDNKTNSQPDAPVLATVSKPEVEYSSDKEKKKTAKKTSSKKTKKKKAQ